MSGQADTKVSPVHIFVFLFLFILFISFLFNFFHIPTEQDIKDYEEKARIVKTLLPFLSFDESLFEKSRESFVRAFSQAQGQSVWDFLNNGKVGKLFVILMTAYYAKFLFYVRILHNLFILFGKLFWFFIAGLFIYLFYINREILEDFYLKLKAKRLSPYQNEDIIFALMLLLKNPVPASILHHNPYKGGLLDHSLRVARISSQLAKKRGLSPSLAFLAGLLHDVGKLKLYRKVKSSGKVAAPSPDQAGGDKTKTKKKEKEGWVSLEVNQKVINRLSLVELSEKLRTLKKIMRDEKIWQVVREADRMATKWELERNLYKVSPYFHRVIEAIEINKEGWRKGDYFIVLASAFNRKLTQIMLEEDPSLPLSEEPSKDGVHVVAYSVVKQMPLVKSIGNIQADELGLFDIQLGGVSYSAVYVFPVKLLKISVEETPYEVIFRSRTSKSQA